MQKRLTVLDYTILRTATARYVRGADHRLQETIVEHFRRETEGGRPRADGTVPAWWELWNEAATSGQGIQVRPSRCLHCNGRGFSTRTMAVDMAHNGTGACRSCNGNRSGSAVRVHLLRLPEAMTAPLRPPSTEA